MEEKIELLRNDARYKDEPITLTKEHALRLLRMQVAKGYNHYSLPKDSKFEFVNGDLRPKANSRTSTNSTARRSNRKS